MSRGGSAVPTVPTIENRSGQATGHMYQGCPDRPDCPDHNAKGLAVKHALATLLEHVEARAAAEPQATELDPERAAMAAHYAAPAQPDRPPCTMKEGLLKGYRDHVEKARAMQRQGSGT